MDKDAAEVHRRLANSRIDKASGAQLPNAVNDSTPLDNGPVTLKCGDSFCSQCLEQWKQNPAQFSERTNVPRTRRYSLSRISSALVTKRSDTACGVSDLTNVQSCQSSVLTTPMKTPLLRRAVSDNSSTSSSPSMLKSPLSDPTAAALASSPSVPSLPRSLLRYSRSSSRYTASSYSHCPTCGSEQSLEPGDYGGINHKLSDTLRSIPGFSSSTAISAMKSSSASHS